MKLPKKGQSHKAQSSKGTERRTDDEQTMTRYNSTAAITDIQRRTKTENMPWSGSQQKPLLGELKLVLLDVSFTPNLNSIKKLQICVRFDLGPLRIYHKRLIFKSKNGVTVSAEALLDKLYLPFGQNNHYQY